MKTVVIMRRYADREFGHLGLGQELETDKIEQHVYKYVVVHVDDHSVMLERCKTLDEKS